MRFILKCAFWLGLVAFLLPFGQHRSETTVEFSWLNAFAGAQEAVADLGGFCDRAPRACETGREAALFAGERIADGATIAYGFLDSRSAPVSDHAKTADRHPASDEAATDPLTTSGFVSNEAPAPPLPRAYTPPKRTLSAAEHMPRTAPAAVPMPAPRV